MRFKLLRKSVGNHYRIQDKTLKKTVFGIDFPNPVGLAAGFDKDGKLFSELASFGFGFIEVGTVTPMAQDGNPKPRLFRLPKDKSLINRMGFNNLGTASLSERMKNRNKELIIGGNIGKNKITPNDRAGEDYLFCFEQLFPLVDYFAVNVSSPNTPDLRELQDKAPLKELLLSLQEANDQKDKRKPILLKIAPDLNQDQLRDIIDILEETKIDGIIATNTTIQRDGLKTSKDTINQIGSGGLSGKALSNRSTEVIRFLKQQAKSPFPIIAAGGIFSVEDAIEKLEAGADLLQIYTGFIYEGPAIVKNINRGIIQYYERSKN